MLLDPLMHNLSAVKPAVTHMLAMLIDRKFVVILALLLSQASWSLSYRAPMDEAVWNLEMSVFECRMTQEIPIYGEAVFRQRAGEKMQFILNSFPSPMEKGKAVLVSGAPEWRPGMRLQSLGKVPVHASKQPVVLQDRLATRLLAELEKGKAPRFTRMSWYGEDEIIDVSLSSVAFRAAYKQYRHCLASLLPVNFEQIRRTRVHFATDKSDITPETKRKLDMILLYTRADPEVNAFYIDGHTDDIASRLYNLELSQKRAEAVTRYLTKNGISEDYVTVRYHGERYPAVKNNSAKNRAYNRRVTIRLEKE
jgi:outer membrane protein OmpA-like peptidoglycan-associated protein